ncbi:MAG TPA: hypothetical protein VGW78_06910 [Candidatus Babeliales bacterium]|jgi:hypothetical protein|nr:hypothetical protein [Candidatus Babeliales bacterium]
MFDSFDFSDTICRWFLVKAIPYKKPNNKPSANDQKEIIIYIGYKKRHIFGSPKNMPTMFYGD